MGFWGGFVVGVLSSGVVGVVYYILQRRDSNNALRRILGRLGLQDSVAARHFKSTMVVLNAAERTNRRLSALERQLHSGRTPNRATFTPSLFDRGMDVISRSREIDMDALRDLHHIAVGDDFDYSGEFRDVVVRVGRGGGQFGHPVPPPPDEIGVRLASVLADWRSSHASMQSMSADERLAAIAGLHVQLMHIHPFFDGNGLVGRLLLACQVRHYMHQELIIPRSNPAYFQGLEAAIGGNSTELLQYLKSRLRPVAD